MSREILFYIKIREGPAMHAGKHSDRRQNIIDTTIR